MHQFLDLTGVQVYIVDADIINLTVIESFAGSNGASHESVAW